MGQVVRPPVWWPLRGPASEASVNLGRGGRSRKDFREPESKGEGSMNTKSLLLTIPLAVSVLGFLSVPANAVCWAWQPCADTQGYGASGLTESQAVLPELPPDLPELPPDGTLPPGATSAPPPSSASTEPGGAPEKLTPPKKPVAAAKPKAPAAPPAPAQAKAAPPPAAPAPAPAQAQAAPPAPPAAPPPAQAQAAPPADAAAPMNVPGVATIKVIPE
jgi:hypothetical protein